jgi:hypothetical protein
VSPSSLLLGMELWLTGDAVMGMECENAPCLWPYVGTAPDPSDVGRPIDSGDPSLTRHVGRGREQCGWSEPRPGRATQDRLHDSKTVAYRPEIDLAVDAFTLEVPISTTFPSGVPMRRPPNHGLRPSARCAGGAG